MLNSLLTVLYATLTADSALCYTHCRHSMLHVTLLTPSHCALFTGAAEPLPVGWKQCYGEQGQIFFYNEQTDQRTPVDPRLG